MARPSVRHRPIEFFDERRSRAAELVRAGIKARRIRAALDVRDGMKAIEAPFLYVPMIDNEPIRSEKIARALAGLLDRFAPPNPNGDQARRRRPRSPATTPK